MPQDILITPYKDSTSSGAKIEFTGLNSGASTITMRVLSDSTLSYEGTAGQLFSISNGLSSGTIFSVNDISGVPSIDVASSGLVRLAPFVGEVQTNKLYVQANPQSGTQTVQEWRNLSGTAIASINTSGQFAGYLASGTGVGGSSGQMQFNAGGTIGGSAAVTFSSGGPNLGITTQGTGNIPFRITTASGHSTHSLEIYHSGALSAAITPDGYLYVTQQLGGAIKSNTVINGSLGNPNVQYRSTVIGTGCSIASGAGVGEATAIGFSSTAAGQYSTAIGYVANAGNTSVALGFQPSATASRAIAIGDIGTANQTNSCAFGTRATVTGAGNFAWATESSDPSMTFQKLNGSNVLKGLYNINTTWISNTNGAEISRVTIGPMYANSMQETIRMDAASDLARVGIGGAASGRLSVYTGVAGNKGIVVQAATSQTANLQEWQDSAGNSLMAVVPGATLVFAANTPNISGTVSNLVTSGSYYVRLNCTWSGSALTGIAPPTGLSQVDGKIMRLINAGTQPMKLTNMATSTATNRFACYNSGDLWMSPNDYYECTYDSTTFNGTSSGGAWRVHA